MTTFDQWLIIVMVSLSLTGLFAIWTQIRANRRETEWLEEQAEIEMKDLQKAINDIESGDLSAAVEGLEAIIYGRGCSDLSREAARLGHHPWTDGPDEEMEEK